MAVFPLPYTVRHSSRAKRLRLMVKPSGIELVVPAGMSEATAVEFLNQQRDWALVQVEAMRARLPANLPPPGLTASDTVPFQGREVPLVITQAAGRRSRIDFDGGFRIAVPPGSPEQTERQARAALLNWLGAWLYEEARGIAERRGQHAGLAPRHIRIKLMKTRWGSCSPQGDINLNLVLAFAPPAVLEYVVVHELCHLRHHNHSYRFWNLVTEHLPDYPIQRQWLKQHGASLLARFG